MENVKLGYAKIYFGANDFGKMLKLKDTENIAITNVQKDIDNTVTFTVATPMDNITNNRVKVLSEDENVIKRTRYPYSNDEYIENHSEQLDFIGIATKKREEKQKKINEFNNVLLNNLESLRELFFQVELSKNSGYYSLNVYPTYSFYSGETFKYENIENVITRGEIKEKTEQALVDFITELLLKYKTDIKGFNIPKFDEKWIFNIDEFKRGEININCESQEDFDELYELLKKNNISNNINSEDFIKYGNRTCVAGSYIRINVVDLDDERKEFRCYITGIIYNKKVYKFKNIEFKK